LISIGKLTINYVLRRALSISILQSTIRKGTGINTRAFSITTLAPRLIGNHKWVNVH
ncbi:hypothetical protein L9F63_004803, partial [Diploptera punctata]